MLAFQVMMTRMHVAYSGGQHESMSWCEGTVPTSVTPEGLLWAEQISAALSRP